jgi:hypothetical protein
VPGNQGEGRGTFPKKVLRILTTCFILLICLFTLAQCGLEDFPFLTPPRSLTKSPTAFRVRKQTANDSEFEVGEWEYQGIELYYKFYLLDQVPVSEKNYTTLTELQNNGFFRITSANDQSIIKPVLAIDTGLAEFQGDVDFRIEMTNLQVTVDEPAPATVMVDQIRRGVRYDNSEPGYPYFRRFLWDDLEAIPQVGFAASHGDVNQELYDFMDDPVNTGLSITMVMYALSYGKQSGLLIDLHSDAVFLGEISINFGW